MLDGVMLLWFVLTAAALLFVAIDIRTTPESPVLKWGFVLLTAYTGVIGAFLYVLGCREPLPGLHERYVAARWRQTLGSTMHCVAGDGVGILAGAVLSSVFGLAGLLEVVVEYIFGFAFGWTIFQALFMRDMAGGSYSRALVGTFVPELVSMNFLMAAIRPVRRQPCHSELLVRDVDGAPNRFRRRLPDQLVASGEPSQARDDDGPACECGCSARSRCSGRRERDVARGHEWDVARRRRVVTYCASGRAGRLHPRQPAARLRKPE